MFTTRRQLLKVAKLGPKAFEQCAGFLRVPESKNVLDNTGVHPESYDAAKGLLELLGATPKDARDLPARLNAYGAEKAAEALGVGVPTLRDIAKRAFKAGARPARRTARTHPAHGCAGHQDLKPGMVLTGTVRNVIDFGVFVDIGVHQDGLVHISQVCNKFIKHPSEAVAVGDVVKVVVLDVDEKKHRISLSMKQVPEEDRKRAVRPRAFLLFRSSSSLPIAMSFHCSGRGVGDERKRHSPCPPSAGCCRCRTCSPGRRSSQLTRHRVGKQRVGKRDSACAPFFFLAHKKDHLGLSCPQVIPLFIRAASAGTRPRHAAP